MPNWCFTSYTVTRSKAEGGIEPLFKFIEKTINEPNRIKTDFGNEWLGDLVEKGLGVNYDQYPCRGRLTYLEENNEEQMTFETETAWSPMPDMFFDLCKVFVPGAEIIFTAEEPGMGEYITNDPVYNGLFIIDSSNDDIESNFEATEQDVRDLVIKLAGESPDWEKIENVIQALREGDYNISINAWDYEDIGPNYEIPFSSVA